MKDGEGCEDTGYMRERGRKTERGWGRRIERKFGEKWWGLCLERVLEAYEW